MIARIFIWIILLIVLPDLYLDKYYWASRKKLTTKKRFLRLIPSIVILVYTICMAANQNFIPDNYFWTILYLFLIGLFVIPKAVFSICSIIGLLICKVRHKHRNIGNFVGLVGAVIVVAVFFYGLFYGWRRLEIKRIDLYVDGLPVSFEGYKITQFSDAHIGSFIGSAINVLQRDIDSINSQHSDMIVFTGDLQNVKPKELYRYKAMMSSLRAKDGVYSILGNHDYSEYINGSAEEKKASEAETKRMEKSFGWNLLLNENRFIAKDGDTLYVVGEENDNTGPYDRDDKIKSYRGVPYNAFVICLQHNPLSWEYSLIPEKPRAVARVTLAGHTHAGQISLFGLRPTMAHYKYDYGLYEKNGYFINVSGGLGGLVQFRLGATPEISVITLHRKDKY